MAVQKTVTFIVILVIVSMVASVLALRQTTKPVNHNGVVKALNVDIYQDVDCTQVLSNASWGILTPGTTRNMTFYIKNLGNAAVVLNMTVTSWNPSAASRYLRCTWNREGLTLGSGNKVQAILTLSLSANTVDVTDFSFVTIIKGTEI